MTCNLSYIIATRNRLPFLKIILEKLIQALLPDEEIIVIDGKSTDGSLEYLEQLYHHKKIQYYTSEADRNQAHAWNKGFMLARGKIIKKIIDDDVFCFTSIQKCKGWMLAHPEIDICITNTLQTELINFININKTGRLDQFLTWKKKETTCFTFSDVYMLIRKDTLNFTGLYDTQFRMIDWEFSLRCSFLGAKIAYYTGYNSLTVDTPNNITSLSTHNVLKHEAQIAKVKYAYPGDQSEISSWSKFKILIGSKLHKYNRNTSFINTKNIYKLPKENELILIYSQLYKTLERENQQGSFNFIC